MTDQPTIVLIHGSFADASGWGGVITRLTGQGFTVFAPPNELRGLASDADYVRAFLATIEGPVVLVGHSYGGAVITNAAVGAPNVTALVYVAAFALDEGEPVAGALSLAGDAVDLASIVDLRPYAGAPEGDADAYLKIDIFPQAFCQDLPAELAAVMAVTQRPGTLSSLTTPSGVPAWKTLPSWYLVASSDRVIPPAAERIMASRAGATTVEVDSSHVAMISHPDEVTELILAAVAGS